MDRFVFDFVKILRKHTSYVIVSGYTAILFGRSRATEDVDILIPKLEKEILNKLCLELFENRFYCLNTSSVPDIFEYLEDYHSVRFARKDQINPNMELKFIKSGLDEETLNHPLKVLAGDIELLLSCIELQITYKKIILGSDKDLEDANHLHSIFKGVLNKEKLKYYENKVRSIWKKT